MNKQAETGLWYAFAQPLGFVVFLIASFAEAARLPFDLPEAEQELVGGYHTEYAGIKLLLFLVSEFLHMVTAAFLIVIMFLGGWHFWGITGSTQEVTWFGAFLRFGILSAKIFAVILFFMVVRWSWPRFRFDQLMNLAWKVMLPLGLLNLVVVATIEEFRPALQSALGNSLTTGVTVGAPWIIFIGGLICAGLLTPSSTDNRPIRTRDSFDQERHLEKDEPMKEQSSELVEV